MTGFNLEKKYLLAADNIKIRAAKESKTLLLLSALRLIVFMGGLVLTWISFTMSKYFGYVSLVVFTGIFLYLLRRYAAHSTKKEYLDNLELINRNEARAVTGDISMFEDGKSFANPAHDFTYDLDIFGPSSLFQYLNRTSTGYGGEVLANWLSEPYSLASALYARQKTITEIAHKFEWRQMFQASAMNKNLERENISGILLWLGKDSPVMSSFTGKILIWALPGLNIITLILLVTGLLNYYFFSSFFLVSLFITFFNLRKTSAIHEELTGRFRFLNSFGTLLDILEKEPFESDEINAMKKGITGENTSAVLALRELGKIIRAFDSRLNILAGFVVNGLFLWDLHCIRMLEMWKKNYSDKFPLWLDMLGKTDAYLSLGNYKYNNPQFVFPELSAEGAPIYARRLGHPLITDDKRVCNDFLLPGPSRLCIISGANMAGKSTFLRTVAVNFILAMTGAPVCAAEMKFTPVRLFTSMRTTDSLSSNESYFYAELKRLRALEQNIEVNDNIFFILDEILKGTNSEDKSQGSRLFIERIIELGGTGLIATHDTSLGTLEKDYPDKIMNKCIEVEIDGENIIFDYLLRDGIASKRNAVLLMRQMGILG